MLRPISVLFFAMQECDSQDYFINELLPNDSNIEIEYISYDDFLKTNKTWDVLVYKCRVPENYPWGFIPTYKQILDAVKKAKPKIVIQIDDEFWYEETLQAHNDIGNYCQLFLRHHHHWNYQYTKNTRNIPLGYCNNFSIKDKAILPIKDRILNWCFIGCDKSDRRECIEKFSKIENRFIALQPDGQTRQTSREKVINVYLNTIFAPITRGWITLESQRIYETLLCGCIPIIVAPQDHIDIYLKYQIDLPCIYEENWDNAVVTCTNLLTTPEQLQNMQYQLLGWWNLKMQNFRTEIKNVLK